MAIKELNVTRHKSYAKVQKCQMLQWSKYMNVIVLLIFLLLTGCGSVSDSDYAHRTSPTTNESLNESLDSFTQEEEAGTSTYLSPP